MALFQDTEAKQRTRADDMRRAAILAAFFWAWAGGHVNAGLVVLVEPDRQAYLFNPGDEPLAFDGYHFSSLSNALDPRGWESISDDTLAFRSQEVVDALGVGALTFGETKPSNFSLAELNLGSFGVLQPGDRFAIGQPFAGSFESLAPRVGTVPGVADDASYVQFSYHQPGLTPSIAGDIIAVPEPAAWLLSGLGGLGGWAISRRRLFIGRGRFTNGSPA